MGEDEKLSAILELCKELKANQEKQGIRLARVDRTIKGDPEYNQDGLIHKVHSHESYISKQKIRTAKQTGVIAGISMAFTGLMEWLRS
jgi:hypothetical protein